MSTYQNKNELLLEIQRTADLFIQEFDTIPESNKNLQVDGVDRTPSQMLAYQLGWMHLIMSWDAQESAGDDVITPTPQYKWNNLGGLYESFYTTYKNYSLSQLKEMFHDTLNQLFTWVDNFSDEELFSQDVRKWASSTPSRWPIFKWIHINTVAPFKSFRTKIRKWKRLNNQVS